MSIQLTWWGHATWQVDFNSKTLVVDPFVADRENGKPNVDAVKVADTILLTHGHADHIADCVALAQRTGARVVANFEIAQWLEAKHHLKKTIGMNLGGNLDLGFCGVKMTIAHHSSQLPDGSYGGNPGGFVLTLGDRRVYFAGDTALFSDMQLIGRMGIDIAILPIGDLFTMGPDDSVEATKLLAAKTVLPSHYNTWPPIEQDAEAWAAKIARSTSARAVVPTPGKPVVL